MPLFSMIPAATGALSFLGKTALGIKSLHEAGKIHPKDATYNSSPYAQNMLSVAQNAYYGQNPASVIQGQRTMGTQANAMNTVQRGATDASQLIASASGIQSNTDNAFSDLRSKDAQEKFGALGVLNQAYSQMINEGDKVYNDQVRKFNNDTQQKNALRSAGMKSIFSGLSDIAGGAMASEDIGGFKDMSKWIQDRRAAKAARLAAAGGAQGGVN